MDEIKAIKEYKIHDSQRGEFGYQLFRHMAYHPDVWLITIDLGYGLFDKHFEYYPERTLNPGASEQSALDIAVGLALRGKVPVVYSITPFLIFRAMETIRNYIDRECIPVKLVGGGRDKDYLHDGFSHFAHDVKPHLNLFPNIVQYWPNDKEMIDKCTEYMLYNDKPSFMSLKR